MKELLTAIYDNFQQRIKNPLLGAYTTFWVIWNSSFLYYFLMADQGVKVKTAHLAELYTHPYFLDWDGKYINTFLPMALAGAYVILFPTIQLWVQMIQNISIEKRMVETARLETFRLKTLEKYEREKARINYIAEILKLDTEKELYQKRIDTADLEEKAQKRENTRPYEDPVLSDKNKDDIAQAIKSNHVTPPPHYKKQDGDGNETAKQKKYNTLNTRKVELFERIYQLEKMKPDRVNDLIDYIIDRLKITDYAPKNRAQLPAVTNFIGFVKLCDNFIIKSEHEMYINFSSIRVIQEFNALNNFPEKEDEWDWFLEKCYPKYTEARLSAAMNEWTRKHRNK